MQQNKRLNEIFLAALAGEGCCEKDVRFVADLASSTIPLMAVRANAVLLVEGNHSQRERAYARLVELLDMGAISGSDIEFEFLTILMQTRTRITFCSSLRQFVYRMCVSPVPGLRCNAVIVLSELSSSDSRAGELLVALAHDEDKDVRHNAEVFLSLKKPRH